MSHPLQDDSAFAKDMADTSNKLSPGARPPRRIALPPQDQTRLETSLDPLFQTVARLRALQIAQSPTDRVPVRVLQA